MIKQPESNAHLEVETENKLSTAYPFKNNSSHPAFQHFCEKATNRAHVFYNVIGHINNTCKSITK